MIRFITLCCMNLLIASSMTCGPAWAHDDRVPADQLPPAAEETEDIQSTETPEADDQSSEATSETDSESDEAESTASEKTSDKESDSAEESPEEAKEAEENKDSAETEQAAESSGDEDSEKSEEEPQKRKIHEVATGSIKVEVELNGIFVADEMEEVALRPEVWSRFRVLEAVPHGTRVKKGDVLVKFDSEDLEEKLAEQLHEQRLSELRLMQQEEDIPRQKRLLELRYEEAKRSLEQLKEDYEYYRTVDRPFAVEIAEYRFKSAQEDLASQQEELEQLKKMYEADEITEETEVIVLRRQEFQVETAELVMELQTASRDYTLNVTLPRNDEYYETALEAAELAYEQAKTAKEIGVTRQTYELEQQRESRSHSIAQHAKLLSDKDLMTVRAPTDGIVYYGRCIDGKWSQVRTLRSKLQPHDTVSPNTVLMTVVKQRPLHVKIDLDERYLSEFKPALSALVTPEADGDVELAGEVKEISPVPDSSNHYRTVLEVELDDAPEWLVAGMECEAVVTTYDKADALVIPAAMVETDEDDRDVHYVMVVDSEEDDSPERRDVELGKRDGKMVEVLKGLEKGDKIVRAESKS